MKHVLAIGTALSMAAGANAGVLTTHTFDLSGLTSNGGFFDAFPSAQFDFGVAGTITHVEFDVNFTSNDPSWQSEATIFIDGQFDGLGDFIAFTAGDYGAPDEPGVFQYSDSFATSIVSDGVVSVTLTESFNDGSVDPDAVYGTGSFVTVTFAAVPAPGALGLMGLGGIVALRRRR